jgi:Tfp pilus assembly protein PilF
MKAKMLGESKKIVCLIALLACLSACKNQANNAWLPSPQINELPMYAGVAKTQDQLDADEKFIASAVALKGSREAASKEASLLGFDYLLKKKDPATAMKRFNQSFLLDPQNGAAYQGMAITTLTKNPAAVAEAESLFKRAASSTHVTPELFADYGRFLFMQKRFAEAIPILQRGVSLAPDYVETNSLLASAYYVNNQKAESCPLAKRWVATAQPGIADNLRSILTDPMCKNTL